MVSIFVKSYGCCANHNNGELIIGMLKKNGYKIAKNLDDSDIVIINSCLVKQTTENRVRDMIENIIKSGKRLVIAGCMPEAEYNICRKIAPDSSLVNTMHIKKIGKIVKLVEGGKRVEFLGKGKEAKSCIPIERRKRDVANVQISEGCPNDCNYCIVQKAKGSLYSFPEKGIIKDVKKAVKEGCNIINITSQDNASYGMDKSKQMLIPLLNSILSIEGNFKIRIGMMNPEHIIPILDELVEIFKNEKIRKFIHIPVQSGSDKVLKEMGRNYKVKDFKKIVNVFRKKIDGIIISTDIIAGYPTEAKEDFEKTVKLLNEIKPEVVNISRFGPRPGTKAALLKQLPTQEIKRRSKALTSLCRGLRKKG